MRKYISLIFLVIFVLGIFVYFFLFGEKGIIKRNFEGGDSENFQKALDEKEENLGKKFYNNDGGISKEGGLSGGGSGGSGGSSGGNSKSIGCLEQQGSYALKNIRSKNNCNKFLNGICVKKTVSCYLDVYNLNDYNAFFGIKFIFFVGLNSNNTIGSVHTEGKVVANGFDTFMGSLIFESVGEEGIANKKVSCLFNTESTPKNKVC